jgi:hypothetical protein
MPARSISVATSVVSSSQVVTRTPCALVTFLVVTKDVDHGFLGCLASKPLCALRWL